MKKFLVFCFYVFVANIMFATNPQPIKPLQETKKFIIPVGNDDSTFIGYKYFEDDLDVTVHAVCTSDNAIFLGDAFHSNIKKINIANGNVTFSENIYPWIRFIVGYNKKLYISSLNKTLTQVNMEDLEIEKKYDIKDTYFVENKNNGEIFAVIDKKINKENKLLNVGVRLKDIENIDTLPEKAFPITEDYLDTYYYRQKVVDGRYCIEKNSVLYEVPFDLEVAEQGYEDIKYINNVYVNSSAQTIAYFNFKEKNLIVYLFSY